VDILRASDVSVDMGNQNLRLAEGELSLESPCAGPRTFSLVVARDQIISAKCEGIVTARLESHSG
jgi:hypothetical protein